MLRLLLSNERLKGRGVAREHYSRLSYGEDVASYNCTAAVMNVAGQALDLVGSAHCSALLQQTAITALNNAFINFRPEHLKIY